MNHDPLCEWSAQCVHAEDKQHSRDTENLAVPDATYCCICGADCDCVLIAKVREDTIAKCIAALPHSTYCLDTWYDDKTSECFCDSSACERVLRSLQEKP